MQYRKFGHGSWSFLAGLVFCFLCLSSWQLLAQSSGESLTPASDSWQLPEWLKPPVHQAPPIDPTKPLLLSMADSLESWGAWSILDENWHQKVIDTVKAILISSDAREKAHRELVAAKDAEIASLKLENSLIKGQLRSQIEVGLLSGGGGFVGGFALGYAAGVSTAKSP